MTSRETEVRRLLTAGRQNQQVGAALGISPRTASFHLTNLLNKLGAESRTAAAADAMRHWLA